jgi:methylthioribose-1-phosphate isomerase
VRGAPAIGVTGALALAVHLISGGRGKQYSSVQDCLDDIGRTMDYLVTRSAGSWGGRAGEGAVHFGGQGRSGV